MSNRSEVNDYRWGIGRFGRAVDREIQERHLDMAHIQMLREAAVHEGIPSRMELMDNEFPQGLEEDSRPSPAISDVQFPEQVSEESPTSNFTETGGADYMSLQEKVLYYAMFILHFGLSDEEIRRMEELMEVLYGTAPPISYEQHVRQLYKNLLNDYNRKRYFFCTACGYPLREWRDLCENVGCALYRVCIKRAKSVQRTEVHVLNIVPQLIDSITNHIEQIINFHRSLHEAEADRGEDRSDIRLFPGYREAIESANEFFACRLRILLSLSVDGFIPRRLSRREVWPLYLRIENIARAEGDNFYNTLLAGALYTPAKPSEAMMETLFSRLESELTDLQATPIAVDMDGSTWTVEVHLYRGIADMAAQKILYGVPAWNRDYGCSKCNIKGIVQGRQRMWLAERDEVTSLRTPESYAEDARNYGQFGILRMTPVMRILLPCAFTSDALHVCSEGVTRDRIRDMFESSSKFPSLRIDHHNIELVKACLRRLSSHTYSNSMILSLEDLRTCKAAELDELAFVTFPLVVAVGMISSPVAAASLLGYWFCLRTMAHCSSLDVGIIRVAQSVAKYTKQIWSEMAPEIFTMKCHWFFDHGMAEELDMYGSPYQWSSAPFESLHRRLQIRVNQSTTNSSIGMIERYLLLKRVRNIFQNCCESGNPVMVSLKTKIENRHKRRIPVGIPIDACTYIPKRSRIEHNSLSDEHRVRITQSHEEAYSRLSISGNVYCSRIYWKMPRSTRQDVVYLCGHDGDEDVHHFASILMFLYNRTTKSIRVLVEEFISIDPFAHLANLVNHTPHPCRQTALQLLRSISANNSFFKELSGKRVRVRPITLIIGPATFAELENRSYGSRS